jgi:hypothetical protein
LLLQWLQLSPDSRASCATAVATANDISNNGQWHMSCCCFDGATKLLLLGQLFCCSRGGNDVKRRAANIESTREVEARQSNECTRSVRLASMLFGDVITKCNHKSQNDITKSQSRKILLCQFL